MAFSSLATTATVTRRVILISPLVLLGGTSCCSSTKKALHNISDLYSSTYITNLFALSIRSRKGEMVCKVESSLCSLSLPICVGFIWIFVGVSQCPIGVKAFDTSGEDITHVTPSVIKVCSEDAISSVHHGTRHHGHDRGGGGREINENYNRREDYLLEVPKYWVSTNETTKFPLMVGDPKCRSSASYYTLLKWTDDVENENYTSTVHFYPNGYFRENNDIYAPDEYCIESFSQPSSKEVGNINLKFCKPDCGLGKKRPCIKKCCPLDKMFLISGRKTACTSPPYDSEPFMPTLYDDLYTKSEIYRTSSLTTTEDDSAVTTRAAVPMPHFILNHPRDFKKICKDGILVPLPASEPLANIIIKETRREGLHSSMFRIRTDGAIMYKSLTNKCDTMSVDLGSFCVEGVLGVMNSDPESPFNNTEDEYLIFQCQVPEKDPYLDKYLSFTLGVLLVTTSIFPFVTTIVYALLWKKQNVHGWTIAATSGSLFFMYIFQGTAHLIGVTLKEEALNTFYCRLLGVLVHFFMMSTFTWCSVMTFDLFITFRSVVPMNQRLEGVSRYLKYSAFGWGVPTLVVAIGLLMDFVIYTSNDCSYHAVPAYGQKCCGLVETSLGEYLYYPAGFLLCVNISLFTATCVKLCMYGRASAIRARKNNDAFGECFSRFSKLFCVMGISWIFEIVSWYVDGLGFVWYWNVIDIFNILRAVAVFAIYVCKSDIIKQLDDSYPTLQRIYRPFGRLFMRKCSDEISTESTVLSAVPNSPAIALKAVNNAATNSSCTTSLNKGRKETEEGVSCEL